jgi:murein DD-endopeptidase MepM/ murein hydrolase activator NlpD
MSGLLISLLIIILVTTQYNKSSKIKINNSFKRLLQNTHFIETSNFLLNKINSPYLNISYKIKNGDSLEKIFNKFRIDKKELSQINNEIRKIVKGNYLESDKNISLVVKKKDGIRKIETINIPISKSIDILVQKDENQNFISQKIITQLFKKINLAEGTIKNSLYNAATKNNVDPNVIMDFASIYGFEIDFQRDIRKNDTFQIVYETFEDEFGELYSMGNIIYAFMSVNGREIPLYRFQGKDFLGHFDINGKSVQKALMKTPINGARLSSRYGLRKHPILGFTKKHNGTDFAAKEGTPIMASGAGTIVRAKWCGGGGNCIKIKHNSTYSTVYAHLKSFATNIKSGIKVKQGQIIGYVGSTGMSTGPHLHYEVHINGKPVNSQKLKLPSGKILKGEDRQKFEIKRIKTDAMIADIIEDKLEN